jgi:hypothetical protein
VEVIFSLHGELVFDHGPHRSQPILWRHREPKVQIDVRHLLERARDTATPCATALFGASRSSQIRIAHHRILHEERGGRDASAARVGWARPLISQLHESC